MRWARASADQLRIDPTRLVVAGDSAGGLLALALATGLEPRARQPVDASELPAAAVAGWLAVRLGARSCALQRGADEAWGATHVGSNFDVPSVLVPRGHGDSDAATQVRLVVTARSYATLSIDR